MISAIIVFHNTTDKLPERNGRYYVVSDENRHDVAEFTKPNFWLTAQTIKYWGEIPCRP